MSKFVLLFFLAGSFMFAAPAEAENASDCPSNITGRSAVIESLHALGNKLAMGRICALQETVLRDLKQQTLQQYAGCLQAYQIKGTEIQDALEAGRPEAHLAWKQAKDKPQLCEQVKLANR